jgi:hypothetical protein
MCDLDRNTARHFFAPRLESCRYRPYPFTICVHSALGVIFPFVSRIPGLLPKVLAMSSSGAGNKSTRSVINNLEVVPSSLAATTHSPPPENILLSLSEACRKHEESRHKNNRTWLLANEHIDDLCRTTIDIVFKTLRKVERGYHHTGKSNHQDIAHVCDFYRNVLMGGFCPHAPRLFQNGHQGTESTYAICRHIYLSSWWNSQPFCSFFSTR